MSFFDPQPAETPEPYRAPPWAHPPGNELGVSVPAQLVLVRREDLVIAVSELVAYTTGFSAKLMAFAPFGRSETFQRVTMSMHMLMHAPEGELPDETLRYGVQFADGRQATSLNMLNGKTEGSRISLAPAGGYSAVGMPHEARFWIWPLPPPGRLEFVVEWPAMDVPLTRGEMDASPIVEAAARSERYWDDDGLDWSEDEEADGA